MNQTVTAEDFARAMKKLGIDDVRPKIAVAVSGGGDSLALALLMHDWVRERGGEILALTVDHQLRPDSADEALTVQKNLHSRGLRHEILTWHGEKPATHVQEMARQARYALLQETCKAQGFTTLAVAHNSEDQVETFWMRLAHGSGLDGLAGMAPMRMVNGISMIRPLLSFTREQMRETCRQFKVDWIDDPSNQNDKYLRVKLRQFEDVLAQEGLTPRRLSQTLQKLEDARDALTEIANKTLHECVMMHDEGYATLNVAAWKNHPRDIQRRVLSQTLSSIAPQVYPAGFDALEQTRLDLYGTFAGKTLAGCEIVPGKADDVLFVREAAAVSARVTIAGDHIWDGKFHLSGFADESLEIGALGDVGLSELRKNNAISDTIKNLPYKVKCMLPALWQGGNLVAVPHVNYYAPNAAAGIKSGRIALVKIG